MEAVCLENITGILWHPVAQTVDMRSGARESDIWYLYLRGEAWRHAASKSTNTTYISWTNTKYTSCTNISWANIKYIPLTNTKYINGATLSVSLCLKNYNGKHSHLDHTLVIWYLVSCISKAWPFNFVLLFISSICSNWNPTRQCWV